MKRHSIPIVGLLAGISLGAPGQASEPEVMTPVVSTPLYTGESPAFSSLRTDSFSALNAETEPYLSLNLESPNRASLIEGLQVSGLAPSQTIVEPSLLTTAVSKTTFQTSLGTLPVTVLKNIQGLGDGYNANWANQGIVPPDTNMAVGPNHIVQWVNIRLSVMDKNGAQLIGGALGYVNGNTIWSGLPDGSICKISNQGDPLVAYDRLADRWVLSQFAFTSPQGFPAPGTYRQCIAVSTTPDPTGTYALYEYTFPNLPDYAKIGVWPDGYYMTFNNFSYNPTTGVGSFAGASSCAFERAKMLTGDPASVICFNYTTAQQFFSILPANLSGGTPPPAGAPNYQVSPDWFFFNAPPYSVQLQKFHVDFATPANSTLNDGIGGGPGSFIKMPIPDVVGACGDGGGRCVPQPGTARVLDTLSMRMMYPLQYRNRGPGLESLIVTQTIDPPLQFGSAVAGMNWLEIRNPGANPPVIRQNGALVPNDGVNRWMGSATMDKLGNIAMGYSASSASVSPSIRIAGRLNADILGRMRGELQVVTGTGSQTSTAQRWGDYSAMQIDPVDDCTFWYTQEYMINTSDRNWATKITAFKFNNCN